MCIEIHLGAKPEDTFHTIQGLLECGNCSAILANIPPMQGLDDVAETIIVCPSCGSEWFPEELADARVEEILHRVNEEPKKPAEQVRILREAAAKVLATNCGDPWDLLDEDDPLREGFDALKAALEATKEA